MTLARLERRMAYSILPVKRLIRERQRLGHLSDWSYNIISHIIEEQVKGAPNDSPVLKEAKRHSCVLASLPLPQGESASDECESDEETDRLGVFLCNLVATKLKCEE